MLCVITGHSVNFWKGTWFTVVVPVDLNTGLSYLSDFMNAFHIFAFTLVSGYLFYYLKIDQGKYGNFFTFLSRKVRRLLVPYIFVCVIWVIPVAEFFFQYSVAEVINRYVLGTNQNQLWFLLMLFWVYIIAWLVAGIIDRKPLVGGLLVMGLYAVGMVGSRIIPNYFNFWTGCEYVLFFWIGFMMRKLPSICGRIKWYVWLVGFIISFVAWEIVDSGVIHSLFEIIMHILGSVAAFEMLGTLAETIDWNKTWFKKLSSKTMPMYLFHQQIIYFTIYWLNSKVNPYIHAGINFVVAIAGSLVISTILMRWKVTRILMGEKA